MRKAEAKASRATRYEDPFPRPRRTHRGWDEANGCVGTDNKRATLWIQEVGCTRAKVADNLVELDARLLGASGHLQECHRNGLLVA